MTRLPIPRTAAGRAGLEALLADPTHLLFASDYDGTLAPIVDDPLRAHPQPGAVDGLIQLAGLVGGVALITGRHAESVVALAGLDRIPGLVVLGAYGAQRWEAGTTSQVVAPSSERVTDAARTAVVDVVERLGPPGTAVEVKGPSVAVHVRGCADPDAAAALLRGPLGEVARRFGLAVEPGRMVLELRPPGTDKGQALRSLVEQQGAATVVFVGDDLGDLAAFAAVDAFREAGLRGLTVASSSAEAPEVAAAADLVVDGPAGVVAFVRGLGDALTA